MDTPKPRRISPAPYEPLVQDTGGNWVPPHESDTTAPTDVFPPGQDPRTMPITTNPPAFISSGRGFGKRQRIERQRIVQQFEDGTWGPVDFSREAEATNIDYAVGTARAIGVAFTPEEARAYISHDEPTDMDGRLARPAATMQSNLDLNTNITVQEITLEVPVTHDKLTHALGAVDATIAGRRAHGVTIPESSRSVTTVGNEIVIRWEEHS